MSDADPWTTHMRRGDFAAAWAVTAAALAGRAAAGHPPCWHWPRHLQPVWDGSPVAGRRVLVRCYHGLGDTVQFIRFVEPLRAVASHVSVWCQPPLCDLIATAAGVDQVLPLHDGSPEVDYDVDVEIMELPFVFRVDLGTLPARVPYLHVNPTPRRTTRFTVGLTWQAGDWDDRRSIPAALLSDHLASIPGIDWISLQNGPAAADRPPFTAPGDTSVPTRTAALMRSLDLVLSVDSFPAHLAGALGVPCWTLLHADPDWRWMLHRDDSPWYPSIRLFRQTTPRDWPAVLDRVAADLKVAVTRPRRVRLRSGWQIVT